MLFLQTENNFICFFLKMLSKIKLFVCTILLLYLFYLLSKVLFVKSTVYIIFVNKSINFSYERQNDTEIKFRILNSIFLS